MIDRNRFRAAILTPVLLAVLVFPAWAGKAVRKGSHYPGQECSGCHKVRGKSTGKAPSMTTPVKITPLKITPGQAPTGTGTPGSKTVVPSAKRAAQPR